MILYVYLGYPVLVFLLAMIKSKKVIKVAYDPAVTIIIAAYNEQENIETTLKNKLKLNYPKENLEIVVVSDASTDRTDDIVRKYEQHGVKLLRQEPRAGKTAALNMGVSQAKGKILVFSDANSIYDSQALRMLVQNFSDPSVGYVTGKMIYTNLDGTTIGDGCTTYMKYENVLRSLEMQLGSVVGVDGGIDAVRKDLYRPMNPDQLPDLVLPLTVVEQGLRVVYEAEAILEEPVLKVPKDEYRMRVRVTVRALWALWDMHHLLIFPRFKLFAWQLWSHKVLRYLCFLFIILAYLTSLALWSESGFYKLFFVLQNIAYLGAIASPMLEKQGHCSPVLYLLNYFIILNLAAAHAFVKFIFGQKQVTWTPRKG